MDIFSIQKLNIFLGVKFRDAGQLYQLNLTCYHIRDVLNKKITILN